MWHGAVAQRTQASLGWYPQRRTRNPSAELAGWALSRWRNRTARAFFLLKSRHFSIDLSCQVTTAPGSGAGPAHAYVHYPWGALALASHARPRDPHAGQTWEPCAVPDLACFSSFLFFSLCSSTHRAKRASYLVHKPRLNTTTPSTGSGSSRVRLESGEPCQPAPPPMAPPGPLQPLKPGAGPLPVCPALLVFLGL